MIKSTFIAVLLIAVTSSAFQCNKDKNRSQCLRGKLIDAMCASYIVQITAGDYDPSRVENNWLDPQTGNTYTNVFAVSNFCGLQGKIAPGDEFNFKFADDAPIEGCITCMALRAAPSKTNKIKLSNCGD
jgi:hypothetical protein